MAWRELACNISYAIHCARANTNDHYLTVVTTAVFCDSRLVLSACAFGYAFENSSYVIFSVSLHFAFTPPCPNPNQARVTSCSFSCYQEEIVSLCPSHNSEQGSSINTASPFYQWPNSVCSIQTVSFL